jgi:hypothetical protein
LDQVVPPPGGRYLSLQCTLVLGQSATSIYRLP